MVDMTFNGATTVAVTGYSSGSFDGRGNVGTMNLGVVNLTLSPSTNGHSTPDENVSTVYGSFGGMTVSLVSPSPGGTAATDGSQTKLVYYDGADDDSGAFTGHTKIQVQTKAVVEINQLQGGRNVPFSAAHDAWQAAVDANQSLNAGAAVQQVGGTWVVLETGVPSPVSIEVDINALTFVNAGVPTAVFNGNLTIIVDTGGTYVIEAYTLANGTGSMVKPFSGDAPGLILRGITPTDLAARATFDGTYLTLK